MKISAQYSNDWETMEQEDDINQYFCVFNVAKKQIVLINTY